MRLIIGFGYVAVQYVVDVAFVGFQLPKKRRMKLTGTKNNEFNLGLQPHLLMDDTDSNMKDWPMAEL